MIARSGKLRLDVRCQEPRCSFASIPVRKHGHHILGEDTLEDRCGRMISWRLYPLYEKSGKMVSSDQPHSSRNRFPMRHHAYLVSEKLRRFLKLDCAVIVAFQSSGSNVPLLWPQLSHPYASRVPLWENRITHQMFDPFRSILFGPNCIPSHRAGASG